MMYTRERLMKAVREAGASGQPFTLGEVRAKLGIKSQDKREQKRFRSRFRECSQILGDKIEQLGPNTFRLKGLSIAIEPSRLAVAAVPLRPVAIKDAKGAKGDGAASKPQPKVSVRNGLDPAVTPADPYDEIGAKRRPREAISFEAAAPSSSTARSQSIGERLSSWFGRSRPNNSSAAATALSRLAVELQPKAANFEYRWIDGKLQVQRAADK